MAASSLFEMLTFSFSGELPLEQVSERDQLILSLWTTCSASSTAGQERWRIYRIMVCRTSA